MLTCDSLSDIAETARETVLYCLSNTTFTLTIMNVNNNAIKRIMADVRELAKHPSPRYSAAPLEDNIFEWHFSIRGPSGTDFEGY